jgi:hypothetical protein
MIGLSLLSVSKHNMWSCYDWVVIVLCVLTDDNNTIIIRSHVVFTDGRQRQPNHNTTIVNKHNIWLYYDWVVVVVVRQ